MLAIQPGRWRRRASEAAQEASRVTVTARRRPAWTCEAGRGHRASANRGAGPRAFVGPEGTGVGGQCWGLLWAGAGPAVSRGCGRTAARETSGAGGWCWRATGLTDGVGGRGRAAVCLTVRVCAAGWGLGWLQGRFAKCPRSSTQQTPVLFFSFSITKLLGGAVKGFAECPRYDTRQNLDLPSAIYRALGKLI